MGVVTPSFRHIYNTKCKVRRCTASVSMTDLLQLLLDGAAIRTALSLCSPIKGFQFLDLYMQKFLALTQLTVHN